MIWESQGNKIVTEIITSQLQALQDAGLFSNKSLFFTDIWSWVFQQTHDFTLRIFEDLWHSFKISDVTIVIPYFKTAKTYTSALPAVQNFSIEAVELYTWYPFLAR
jgi:DNA polymerase III delta subunit